MKTILPFALASLLACTAPRLEAAAESQPLTTAVLSLQASADLAEEAEKITLLLGVHLSDSPALSMVERVEVDKVLGEMELGLSGAVNPAEAAKLGQMLGAKVLVSGKLVKVGSSRMVVAKVIGVETGRVHSVAEEYADSAQATTSAVALAEKLLGKITTAEAGLVAKVESWEDRVARLRKSLPVGAALPKIRVSVPEQHLSAPVPDPAAQTEIQRVLQELGFTLIESGPADYEVTGEAFSERGAQRGQLVSCRARIEIKANKSGDGEIWVDRQTTSALDTAEHIAGKSALQEAGLLVADRLVSTYLANQLR
jgi:hypothetical protein